MAAWIDVDCGEQGYQRDLWIRRWRETLEYFFGVKPIYDFNGSKIHWAFHDEELGAEMSDIWTLKAKGYRTSYQSKKRTFFWIDNEFYDENRKDILKWAELNGCKVVSRVYGWIEMPDKNTELMFRLIWAGKSYG